MWLRVVLEDFVSSALPSQRNRQLGFWVWLVMKATLATAILLVLLVITIGWAIYAWVQLGDVHMSWHGYAAMILGIVFSLLVGCGLIGLMFYSSRHGYDEPFDPNQSKPNGKSGKPQRSRKPQRSN